MSEFSKIKTLTVGEIPFDLKFSRTFLALACLCSECYIWIKYPNEPQTASFGAQKYTLCEPCATNQLAKETKPKQNPVKREGAEAVPRGRPQETQQQEAGLKREQAALASTVASSPLGLLCVVSEPPVT